MKDYWKYVPEDYTAEMAKLDSVETEEFLKWVNLNETLNLGYDEMTPQMFYDASMFIYQLLGYNVENMTPKEAYLKYADGRDCGLSKLEEDSAEGFREWYEHNGFGDHTDEISGGIRFRVLKSENGKFAFYLENVNHSDKDLIHVLLEMIRAGYLFDAAGYSRMRNYIIGHCWIGIAPYGNEFDFMQEYYTKKRTLEKCKRLPSDAPEEMIETVDWLQVRICELAGK